jgi:hypothetical protein
MVLVIGIVGLLVRQGLDAIAVPACAAAGRAAGLRAP